MERTLVLEVPEDVYEPLAKTAKRTGQTAEELAMEWLVIAIQNAIDDPMEDFIGAFPSSIPDWADQHEMNTIKALAIQPNAYYTVEEAAQLLRVSRQTVLRLLQSGRAQGVRIGRQWRILGAALLDLSAHEQETETSLVHEWLAASIPSLSEVWDNEEDAVYDQL